MRDYYDLVNGSKVAEKCVRNGNIVIDVVTVQVDEKSKSSCKTMGLRYLT